MTNQPHAGNPANQAISCGPSGEEPGSTGEVVTCGCWRQPTRWTISSVSRFKRIRNHFFRLLLLMIVIPLAHAGGEDVVKWPSLKKLDDLAERCEALCGNKDISGLRKIAAEVKDAAKVVASDTVPQGAKQPGQVKVLQEDLKSLADSIGDADKQDGEELSAILAGIHPVVEQLMEASGMPHVHEEKEGKPK